MVLTIFSLSLTYLANFMSHCFSFTHEVWFLLPIYSQKHHFPLELGWATSGNILQQKWHSPSSNELLITLLGVGLPLPFPYWDLVCLELAYMGSCVLPQLLWVCMSKWCVVSKNTVSLHSFSASGYYRFSCPLLKWSYALRERCTHSI